MNQTLPRKYCAFYWPILKTYFHQSILLLENILLLEIILSNYIFLLAVTETSDFIFQSPRKDQLVSLLCEIQMKSD